MLAILLSPTVIVSAANFLNTTNNLTLGSSNIGLSESHVLTRHGRAHGVILWLHIGYQQDIIGIDASQSFFASIVFNF